MTNGTERKNMMKPKIQIIIAIILAITGIFGAVYLKRSGDITEWSLVSLIAASVVLGVFIAYSDKIKELSFLKGSIALREMKEAESSIKELAQAMVELAEASEGNLKLESWDSERYENAKDALKNLSQQSP